MNLKNAFYGATTVVVLFAATACGKKQDKYAELKDKHPQIATKMADDAKAVSLLTTAFPQFADKNGKTKGKLTTHDDKLTYLMKNFRNKSYGCQIEAIDGSNGQPKDGHIQNGEVISVRMGVLYENPAGRDNYLLSAENGAFKAQETINQQKFPTFYEHYKAEKFGELILKVADVFNQHQENYKLLVEKPETATNNVKSKNRPIVD